ncbi:MAG: hypothetical protein ACRDY5_01475, partial [Acidimicrobiales bacterium]
MTTAWPPPVARTGPVDQMMVGALSGWSDERLAALLKDRPDLAHPPPVGFAALAVRAAMSGSVALCLRRLNLFEQQLVNGLCLLENGTTEKGLVDLLGEPVEPAVMEAGLARLEALALVVRNRGRLHSVDGVRSMQFPAGLGPPAEAGLG